ncbi:MAG: hypothetical protein HUJ84_00950 [Veillonella sp.]|nr:hypothetical protein [Veillonella sp.]
MMPTSSFLHDIVIENEDACRKFVDALEEAYNKEAMPLSSVRYTDVSDEKVKNLF